MVTGTCVVGILLLSILRHDNLKGLLTSYSIATLLFIPAAIIVTKYKLYSPTERKKNLNSLLFSIIFAVVLIIAPKIGSTIKEIIGMFGFEMVTLSYVLVRRLEKVPS
jgi:hypothetical protein